jgi:peptidyl-prolyl cis-trans isomerase SurA
MSWYASHTLAGVVLDRIIAVINNDIVMRSELDERIRTVIDQMESQGTPLPPMTILQKQVLDRLILTKLQIQEALGTGIRVDDETLNRTISNIAAENQVSLSEFRNILEADDYSYAKFREDIRNEILISRLVQREVTNRVNVSQREIDNFLANMQTQGAVDTEYQILHILMTTPQNASLSTLDSVRQEALSVLEEVKAGADFGQMAATHSDGQQALNGGDLGWRKAGQVPTLFADFIAVMEPGDVSEIITSSSGYHIIKLKDIRTGDKIIITQTKTRHILLTPNEIDKEADILRRLEQLRNRLVNGDDFAELSRAHSTDTMSAAQGGDLGWMSPGELVPQFEEMMNSLAIGELSPPFQTQFGWHILEVMDRREHDNTEDVKRANAREAIRQRKLGEAQDNWLRQMRDDAYVEYRLETPE